MSSQQPRLPPPQRRAPHSIQTPTQPPGTQRHQKQSPLKLARKRSLLTLRAQRAGSPLRWQSWKGQVLEEQDSCSLRCPVIGQPFSSSFHFKPSCWAAHPSSCVCLSLLVAANHTLPFSPCPFASLCARMETLTCPWYKIEVIV